MPGHVDHDRVAPLLDACLGDGLLPGRVERGELDGGDVGVLGGDGDVARADAVFGEAVNRLLPISRSTRWPSRASRTASTSHAFRDWPIRVAASSARALTDSGSRSVIRDWLSSSGSGAD